MSSRLLLAFSLISFCTATAEDKKIPPATQEQLSAITARGRSLFEYERAVWEAHRALASTHKATDTPMRFIAHHSDSGWAVVIGSIDRAKGSFEMSYEVAETGSAGKVKLNWLKPSRSAPMFFEVAATAIDTAQADFHGESVRYDTAVLPADADRFYVYVYPAITKPGVLPLGGDVRYLVSPNGKTIIEKRPLHKTILETTNAGPAQVVAGFHSHVITDVPEDTDVVHAMLRRIPEYVGCAGRVYKVAADGTITLTK